MLKFITLGLYFVAVLLLAQILLPFFLKRYSRLSEKKSQQASGKLEDMFIWVGQKKLALFLGLAPIILGLAAFLVFGNPLLIFSGMAAGFILPPIVIKQIMNARRKKFHTQLVDLLISLSQSLKAGLSFLQALEVVIEDMPPPMSEELSLVVKENKMGVPLEASLERLNKKMNLDDLNLMITAILIARETGGNISEVFNHLGENIRVRNKINDQVMTLTTQARWQGLIMSALPVVFAVFIYNMNPNSFDIMFESETGRLLLFWCVISEVIGAVMIHHLSRVEV